MSQIKRLPPGWDQKCEPRSGKSYFVNYFTRHVTLDDPRGKDQDGTAPHENARGGRHVPFMGATAVQSNNQQLFTPETVQKIRAMFPTVPETHIKALLLKYHGREAVVVSALQVEKYPVATPGPFTPPPTQRATVRVPTPLACRPPPKPHSPKMKLRYLKSVFPVVEETLLLDTLCSSDNNVTYATERLINLGFNKKDTPPPRVSLKKKESQSKEPPKRPPPPVKERTSEEKQKILERMCKKHANLPEKVVTIALDSAAYNEDTAETILALMLEEKPKDPRESNEEVTESPKLIREEAEVKIEAVPICPITIDKKVTKKRQKGRSENRQVSVKENHITVFEESQTKNSTFESPLLIKAQGPKSGLTRGPDESLLLLNLPPDVPSNRLCSVPNSSVFSVPNSVEKKSDSAGEELNCEDLWALAIPRTPSSGGNLSFFSNLTKGKPPG